MHGYHSFHYYTDYRHPPPYISTSVYIHLHHADQPQCVNGFATDETLQSVILQYKFGHRLFSKNTQSVSPHTSFTCDGNVTKWIMRWLEDTAIVNLIYPELQVWRSSNDANATLQLIGSMAITGELGATRAIANNVYEFTVDPPLSVQAGDVLGIYRPESRIMLFAGAELEGSNEILLQTTASRPRTFPDPALTVESIFRVPLISAEVGT